MTRRSQLLRLRFVFRELANRSPSGNPVTAGKLAGEWEVSTKTIHRDIETLRAMKCDIVTQCDGLGHGNGYTMRGRCCPFCSTPWPVADSP